MKALRPLVSPRAPQQLERLSTAARQSYVHGASNVPFLYETVGNCLRKSLEKSANREFVVFSQQNIRKTYEELYDDSRRLATGLIHLGLKKGDRVGVWGPNFYEWVTAQMAISQAGMIQVNVNPSYHADELRFTLEKVGVKALITPPAHRHSNYYRTLIEVLPSIASSREGFGHVHSRELPELEHIIVFGEDSPLRGTWSYSEIMDSGDSTDARVLDETKVLVDSPVNIQFTSGTTGFPKAATLTHMNIVNNAFFWGRGLRFHEGEHRVCIPNPLYHCYGCVLGVLTALVHEQTCVFPSPTFNSATVLQALEKEKCTDVFGTPTMFVDMLAQPNLPKLPHLRGGTISGASCPVAVCKRLVEDLGMRDLAVAYGATELSPAVTLSSLEDAPEDRIKNVGYVLDHTEVSIVDSDGAIVPAGATGEILVRGYLTMRGYWGDEEMTARELTPDRWYHTGDLGRMNLNGSISIVGRVKDMIIRGGENIYPSEIEQFLFKLPCVADAQVVGVPDEKYGEEVCVWVRLRPGNEGLTAEDIRNQCKGKMAYYKIPRYILIKQEVDFPMTQSGKVRKTELRELSMKELGLEQVEDHFNA